MALGAGMYSMVSTGGLALSRVSVTACAPQMLARFNRFTDRDHRYATAEVQALAEVSLSG